MKGLNLIMRLGAGADLRGTKPAPNGIDFPGRCIREIGLLGNSAISLTNAHTAHPCLDKSYEAGTLSRGVCTAG